MTGDITGLAELRRLTDEVTKLAHTDDRVALHRLARDVRAAHSEALLLTGWSRDPELRPIVEELDAAYDKVFPVRDRTDPYDVLDAPWPTASREALLGELLDCGADRHVPLEPLAERAIGEADVPRLHRLALTPVGTVARETVVAILDALYAADALDAEVVEAVFARDRWIGDAIRGRGSPDAPDSEVAGESAKCLGLVHDYVNELIWRLTGDTKPVMLPGGFDPRGLRFVRRALEQPDHWAAELLGGAVLTDAERASLVEWLAERPGEMRERAFRLRLRAGDAEALLPLLGMPGAEPLLRLIRATDVHLPARQDRAVLLAAVREAGEDAARELLRRCPSEVVSAALGDDRTEVRKRVRRNALWGIAAYGLLPLAVDETVLDRYLELREVGKRGAKLGPNRRHSHAAAVAIALDHLAQVAGYPDPERLEWDCEARLVAEAPEPYRIGDYTVAMALDDAEPVITVEKAGRRLKSVPAAVRSDPGYAELREHQQRLREQASRLRTGLVERLVATEGTLAPDELARLRRLPAGAALLPRLIWRDHTDTRGLLDQVNVTGPVTAVHPYRLYERGELSGWQAEVVSRRVVQPVKQVFRELYVLTPAERDAVDASRRFAGQVVDGKVAGQLLSGRGWSIHGEYNTYQATRPVDGRVSAALCCEFHRYFGLGDVVIGELRFLSDGAVLPLARVSPVAFSEVMRDLDLVVSVAGTEPDQYASPSYAASRAQLLAALIDDLGLERVHVAGSSAVVRGSRATYRVHLNSGSIHVEPAGYLCVVPESFGRRRHRDLFLPFADPDQMTSVILSKVLLLAQDEKITDPSALAQLARLTPVPE